MKTRLSELFFDPSMVDKSKALLEAFAVTPLPEEDFLELTNEFKRLQNENDVSFNSYLIVDRNLIDIILNSSKKYVNFCFVERDKNISLMLHLSDNISSLDADDEVYYLQEYLDNGITVHGLIPSANLFDLLNEKKTYEKGLGDYINVITNTVNTRIVSYEKDDIALFNFNMAKNYPGMWKFFKYVKISFILFKIIKGSILDSEYKKRLGRISITLQYYFETQDDRGKVISLSSPSDITSLWP